MLPDKLDWSSAIGLFLINFGALDHHLFAILKDNLTRAEFDEVKKMRGFKARTKRIKKLLIKKKCPAVERAAFAQLFKRLEPIRELRNHIAHGHFYIQRDPQAQNFTLTIMQAKDVDDGAMPGTRHVQFAELATALATLGSLIEELGELAGVHTDAVVNLNPSPHSVGLTEH